MKGFIKRELSDFINCSRLYPILIRGHFKSIYFDKYALDTAVVGTDMFLAIVQLEVYCLTYVHFSALITSYSLL